MDHRAIKRRDLPGYCPQRWCAVCGKAAAKTAPYVRCEGRNDCPNVCHSSCLGDRDLYVCDDTQELRRLWNIEDAVAYLPLITNEDPPTLPAATNDCTESGDATLEVDPRQHFREMDKEDLISHNIRLQNEVTKKNNIIQSLTLQRDWILDKKSANY